MKIVIFTFIFTIQAEYLNEEFSTSLSNIDRSTIDLITNEINQFHNNDKTTEDQTSSSSSSFYITSQNEILNKEEEWINPEKNSDIFWKKMNNHSTYILKSNGKCLKKMCYIKLKYNYLLLNKSDGCLSFIIWTYGQPVGQLWIEEDDQQESFSQKIQLTNSSLHVQHSFKSNIKYLSIDGRILFENPLLDTITLSNLNIYFNGSCPIYSSIINSTLSEEIFQLTTFFDETTFENSLITDQSLVNQSSIIKLNETFSLSYLNEKNILWIFLLIILLCLIIIFSSIIYGLWTIRKSSRFIWYTSYNHPIQFLSRKSFHSSTKSNIQIKTLEQLANEIYSEEDHFSTTTISSQNSQLNSYF